MGEHSALYKTNTNHAHTWVHRRNVTDMGGCNWYGGEGGGGAGGMQQKKNIESYPACS